MVFVIHCVLWWPYAFARRVRNESQCPQAKAAPLKMNRILVRGEKMQQ